VKTKFLKSIVQFQPGRLLSRLFVCGFLLSSFLLAPGEINDVSRVQAQAGNLLPQGDWDVIFVYEGYAIGPGSESSFKYQGNGQFRVGSNDVVIGDWEASVQSFMSFERGGCTSYNIATGTMTGVIEGLSNAPIFRDTGARGTATGWASGAGCNPQIRDKRLTISFSDASAISSGISVPREVSWEWISCEQAIGTFGGQRVSLRELAAMGIGARERQQARERLRGHGIDMGSEAFVHAYRRSALRPTAEEEAYRREVADLLEDAAWLKERILEGSEQLSTLMADLDFLLSRAENLYSLFLILPDCRVIGRDAFNSLIEDTVRQLLEFALANPDRFSNEDLLRLIHAAIRAGVFGSRTVSLFGAETLSQRLEDELLRRIEKAVGRGGSECELDLGILGLIGDALGNSTVVTRASTAVCRG